MDFGYSTRFAKEDDIIDLPKSRPWDAPDSQSNCTPAQAQKMDLFSFGMLCFWIIFEKYLSGVVPFPEEAYWAREYAQGKEENDPSRAILEDLKQEDKLTALARQLLMADKILDDEKKGALGQFFSASLAWNANERKVDLTKTFNTLSRNW